MQNVHFFHTNSKARAHGERGYDDLGGKVSYESANHPLPEIPTAHINRTKIHASNFIQDGTGRLRIFGESGQYAKFSRFGTGEDNFGDPVDLSYSHMLYLLEHDDTFIIVELRYDEVIEHWADNAGTQDYAVTMSVTQTSAPSIQFPPVWSSKESWDISYRCVALRNDERNPLTNGQLGFAFRVHNAFEAAVEDSNGGAAILGTSGGAIFMCTAIHRSDALGPPWPTSGFMLIEETGEIVGYRYGHLEPSGGLYPIEVVSRGQLGTTPAPTDGATSFWGYIPLKLVAPVRVGVTTEEILIANRRERPSGVTFLAASVQSQAALPDLAPGEVLYLWFERYIPHPYFLLEERDNRFEIGVRYDDGITL